MPTEIIVHHSAGEDTDGFDVAAIKWYHTQQLHWLDIGYHALVDTIKGEPFAVFGRPWHWAGAHCKGHNDRALGICFIGDYSKADLSDAALLAGVNVIKTWMRLYQIPAWAVHRHSDFAATECPGRLFPWMKLIRLCGGTP